MNDARNSPTGNYYEIKIKGQLPESWTDWFDGLTFTYESDGTTRIKGEIIDQAALHGVLKKVRDLGLPLLSMNLVDPDKGKRD